MSRRHTKGGPHLGHECPKCKSEVGSDCRTAHGAFKTRPCRERLLLVKKGGK